MQTNLELIREFETLYKPFDQTRLTADTVSQSISLRSSDDKSWKMVLGTVGFSFVMMLIAGANSGIKFTWDFILYCLVPGTLVILLIKYWKTKVLVIDLLNKKIMWQNFRLLIPVKRIVPFEDVKDIIWEKQYINGIFISYAVVLKTKEGKINWQLFTVGRNEELSGAIAVWCKKAICFDMSRVV